jgi:hypothetical protein
MEGTMPLGTLVFFIALISLDLFNSSRSLSTDLDKCSAELGGMLNVIDIASKNLEHCLFSLYDYWGCGT